MLIRGETTEDRIAKIAQGFNQGAQNFIQGQDRQRTQSLQDEANRRQQALQALEIEAKISENTGKNVLGSGLGSQILSGEQVDLQGALKDRGYTPKFEREQAVRQREATKAAQDQEKYSYEASQRALPIEQRDDYKKSVAAAGARAQTQENMYNTRQEGERQKKIGEVQIQDFEIANPRVIPTTKDAEEIKSQNASNKTFQEIGQRVKGNVLKANPRDPRYFLSNDWRVLNQDLTKLKLQAKNLEDLGVLNGPDLSLVNETFGSLTPANLALLGPEAASQRLQGALDNAQKVLNNAASARGYKPAGQSQQNNQAMDPLRSELEQLRALKRQQSGA